eukprot:1671407-Alexandrium_andersonii.AAC.1
MSLDRKGPGISQELAMRASCPGPRTRRATPRAAGGNGPGACGMARARLGMWADGQLADMLLRRTRNF